MKRNLWIKSSGLAAFALTAFLVTVEGATAMAAPTISAAEARSMCDNINKQFTAGLSLGNAAAIATLYSPEAILLPPGGVEATGREQIGMFWENTRADGATGLALSINSTEVVGEVIIENGRYALISGQVGVVETGKYLIVRRREAGQWRIFRHIWNAAQPLSGAS